MKPANAPRAHSEEKLVFVDSKTNEILVGNFDLVLLQSLRKNDLLVVNDAATLPASIRAVGPERENLEVRLVSDHSNCKFTAVVFENHDWRTRTESRQHASLKEGDLIDVSDQKVRVVSKSSRFPELLQLEFLCCREEILRSLYSSAKPIQYSHLEKELALFEVQTLFSSRPWALEMASGGHALTWRTIAELATMGVKISTLTHAAGVSSIGDSEIDKILPLPERYEIPQSTIDTIATCLSQDGRVIAVGTSVARALEGDFENQKHDVHLGITDLLLLANRRNNVVSGILTGLHDQGASHFSLLESFAPKALLGKAYEMANEESFQAHEFGDSMLIL